MDTAKKTVGTKGKVIHSQAREIIANVLQFMKAEADNGTPTIPLTNYKQRLLAATQISAGTYQRIVKESQSVQSGVSTSFSTPHKRPRKNTKSTLPEGEIESIRALIHDFYITEKRRPTLQGIYDKIQAAGLSFTGSVSTLAIIVKRMGFRWQKTSDKRKILMESHDIRLKRIKYLNQLIKYKEEGRPIIFTDETYIHSTHTQPHEWSDNSMSGLKKPVSKGKRLIIVHAGGKTGFVPNARLIFTSGTKSGDYHDEMNFTNFSRWITTQLVPNLPPKSVLVIDNASYHNVTLEKNITSASLKNDMLTWLAERNITHNSSQTKAELYEIIKFHKPSHPRYALDTLLHKHGHAVLRLPPYHPELNPIEKIWANVKNFVAARNVTFKLEDVKALAIERFEAIGEVEWSAVCSHADKVVEKYLITERVLDDAVDTLRFTVNTGESEDSELSGVDYLSDSDN